jgi:hypothetical protein
VAPPPRNACARVHARDRRGRYLELNVGATLQLDWNGLAGVTGPTAHAGLVAGVEVGVPFDEQRIRPALFTGVKMGAWADEVHGPFGFVEGARIRLSPFMWDVFDLYLVMRADFDLQPGASPLFRPGVGVGLRAARLFAVEATWDVTVPLGSDFAGTRYPSLVPYGVSFGVLFDTCFQCNRGSPPQVRRDLACCLYQTAAAQTSAQADICDAVARALLACPQPQVASRLDDGTGTFLGKLLTEVKSEAAKRVVAELVRLHERLLRDWAAYAEKAVVAAQRDRQLDEQWVYAPAPAELRAYLGCDKEELTQRPLAAPTCREVAN